MWPTNIKEMQKMLPQIPWLKYFRNVVKDSIEEDTTVLILVTPYFYQKLADLINSTDKRVVANYMMMRAVLESSKFMSEEWHDIYEYVLKVIPRKRGKEQKILKHRWKRCLSSVVEEMDTALSSYYIRYYFSDENKDEAIIFVEYIHKAFLKILEETDWMDEKTKKKAEEKAKALESFIGYPKEMLNDTFMTKIYENLTITTDSYLENVLTLHKMATDNEYSTIGKPWNYKQETKFKFLTKVNAFYHPAVNSMFIPAGVLHDAFYDRDRPNYLNFGAIGYIIGHEITHGFDDKGRHFNKDGKMENWWDEDSDKHFRKKAQCIVDQYDNYTTDLGLKINGEKTQNENIADNGGLKEAYWAYNSWVKDNGIEPTLPGLNYTQNQLFWLSAAHMWCSKYEAEKLRKMLLIDPHTPGLYRVIGPMSNLEEFSRDFKCSADSPMNRKYKCKVW